MTGQPSLRAGIELLLLLTLVLATAGAAQYAAGVRDRRVAASRAHDPPVPLSPLRELRERTARWARRSPRGRRLSGRLERAGVRRPLADVLLILAGAVVAAAGLALVVLGALAAVLAVLVVLRGATTLLERATTLRRERFVAQLPEVARLLSNAVEAGLSLRTALALTAREVDEPARTELEHVAERLALGASLTEALEELDRRVPSRELSVLVRTLIIQARSGGRVVEALRRMSDTLESRKELRREVRTVLAGPLYIAYLMPFAGLASLFVLSSLSPGLAHRFLTEPIGQVALVVAGALVTVAALLIRRQVRSVMP